MTGSRNRPAQGLTSNQPKSATDAGLGAANRTTRDGFSDRLCGFLDKPFENQSERRQIGEMKLHQVLKQLMLANGESARSAAKACRVPLSTFSSYLGPKKQVDPAHLVAIANHYGVTTDFLLTGRKPHDESFKKMPTKKLFSKWVKVTIEDLEDLGLTEAKEAAE